MPRLRRLIGMPVAELAERSRQEAAKWLERVGVLPTAPQPEPEAAAALLERFRRAGTAGFFEGALRDETASAVAARMPEAAAAVAASAEAICQGRFDLLGYRGLSFGEPIDWSLDPVSGRRAPMTHWSRLNALDLASVGDSKVTWELGRHQWLVRLGQAYRLTGDERYASAAARYLGQFLAANPPGQGIHWSSSLEVALRLIAWSWALHLLRRSTALTAGLFAAVRLAARAHARHVMRYLSHYFSPNTHLTGEALGLVYAALAFPAGIGAGGWLSAGLKVLESEVSRQVLADGVYFEQSTCYQRYTVETYLHLLILARRAGLALTPGVEERLQSMLDVLLALRRPDGTVPAIGDADGGWLLPLGLREPGDLRGVFATAAVVFERSDYAWAAGGLAPETLWLLGPDAAARFDELRPQPPDRPSRAFLSGGYAVMRSGWEPRAHHLIFDVGPLGCPVTSGHGHADLLSVQCSAFGATYLVDPGTGTYTGDPAGRDYLRGTGSHSTVTIDGRGQAEPNGPFAWRERPEARLRRWISTDLFDFADAFHGAYGGPSAPLVHRRRVLFVKPRYWIVVDDLEGAGAHRVEVRWQFAPVPVTLEREPWACAQGPDGSGLLLRAFSTAPLRFRLAAGETDPLAGWISPDYGCREPAPLLVGQAEAALPLRILTLLLPVADVQAPPPAVSALPAGGPGLDGLTFEGGELVRLVDDDDQPVRFRARSLA